MGYLNKAQDLDLKLFLNFLIKRDHVGLDLSSILKRFESSLDGVFEINEGKKAK